MDTKCYKIIDGKGRILLPVVLRELSGINKNDVVQICCCKNVLLINKVIVQADNPVEVLMEKIKLENEQKATEREKIKSRVKKQIAEGRTLDEIIEEILLFLC